MRYTKKLDTPQFFTDDTKDFTSWNDYSETKQSRAKRRKLNKYILSKEQNYLCIYCESRITSSFKSSHVEHIKPKDEKKYPELTFDYSNLAVSCEGKCHNKEGDNKKYNCGYNKLNSYDEKLFLNPTLVKDISDYFEYETYFEDSINKVRIKESSKNVAKSKYMLDILNLNDENTNITKERYLELVKFENEISDANLTTEEIILWLEEESLAFISFLRYKYSNIL